MPQFDERFMEDVGFDTELKEPPMYKVILLNDDYTPMDFVVMVLESVFYKNETEAFEIMMSVHEKGSGLCGIFPFALAEAKVRKVESLAEKNEYPLCCSMEEE